MRLELGMRVSCTDGKFGELADLVIDPTAKRVTHLVVRPRDPSNLTQLVPVARARPAGDGEVCLDCTVEEAREFEPVQEFAYLRLGETPVEDPKWDVGVEEVLAMPYYGTEAEIGGYVPQYDESVSVTYDRVPKGEVEVRRASSVVSAGGEHVGHVDGFVVDDEHITHFVLERGHLWRKREVTIPIGAVAKVETDEVTLTLSTEEVGELPSVPVRRWH